MHPAGRALIGLWAAIALLAGGGAATLWWLGPPRSAGKPAPVAAAGPAGVPPSIRTPTAPADAAHTAHAAARPGTAAAPSPATVVAVAPPVPALSEPAPDFPDRTLPVIGTDGRTPSTAYAARSALPASGPQVAILLEGLGLSDTLDHDAVDTLPAPISFAVSPYADALGHTADAPLLAQARRNGHELWLSLPMEPAGSPADTEGTQALSSGIDLAQDRKALEWSLSRFAGYVGVTNALGGLRGDRFASGGDFAMVSTALGHRGLLYVDAGLAPHEQPAIDPPGTRHADLSVDESPDAADIQARLSRLEQLAQANGSALGIAGPLRPATLDRLRGWTRGLRERGITLVPVSALPSPHPPPPSPSSPDGPATGSPPAVTVEPGPAAVAAPPPGTNGSPAATPKPATGVDPGTSRTPDPQ